MNVISWLLGKNNPSQVDMLLKSINHLRSNKVLYTAKKHIIDESVPFFFFFFLQGRGKQNVCETQVCASAAYQKRVSGVLWALEKEKWMCWMLRKLFYSLFISLLVKTTLILRLCNCNSDEVHTFSLVFSWNNFLETFLYFALSAGAVEYADCTSAEG